LSAASHHLDILFFEIRCGTEFTGFCASHAGIYAALPFCILERSSSRRHISIVMVMHSIYQQSTVLAEQKVHKNYPRCLPAQMPKLMMMQIPKKLLLLFKI
jgi:hypothetical protein